MKHPKKSFVSAFLAVAIVITCFLSFGGITAAATDEIDKESAQIYYFNDFYPYILEADLITRFPDLTIVYDRQIVNEIVFSNMVNEGYFTGFTPGSVVIIEIKTFTPGSSILQLLFQWLHDEQGCSTVFISPAPAQNYEWLIHQGILDYYEQCNFDRITAFIPAAFDDLQEINNTLQDTCILIDGDLVNYIDPEADVTFWGSDMNTLCEVFPFLRYLLDGLNKTLGGSNAPSIGANGYTAFVEELYEEYNIRLIVHTSGDEFIDIYRWQSYNAYTVEELHHASTVSDENPWEHICAFGFLKLSEDFHAFLEIEQETLGGFNGLPVYALVADLVEFGQDGLEVMTDFEACGGGIGNLDDEEEAFIEALRDLLGY